jgi:hypothetical protein
METLFKFLYQLFFTRDDDLDILQVLFAAIIVVTLVIAFRIFSVGDAQPTVQIQALVTLRWLVGLLVITAVPKWLVPFMVKNVGSQPHEKQSSSSGETPDEPIEQ